MTLEWFRALTPIFIFVIGIIEVGLGFFFVYLLRKIDRVDREHQVDQRQNYEKFITSQTHYMSVGKIDGLMGEIFKELKSNAQTLNQVIGELKAKGKE